MYICPPPPNMDLTGVAAAFTILTSADTSFDILSMPSALMPYVSILSCCSFSFVSSNSICPASSTARSSNCSTSAFSFWASTFNCIFSCLCSILFSLILSARSSRLSTFRIAALYSGKVRLSRLTPRTSISIPCSRQSSVRYSRSLFCHATVSFSFRLFALSNPICCNAFVRLFLVSMPDLYPCATGI